MEKPSRYTPSEMAFALFGVSPENNKERRQMGLQDAVELTELTKLPIGGRRKRNDSKRKASKRNASKRNASKRKASKRKASKRKASKRKASKRNASRRRTHRRK